MKHVLIATTAVILALASTASAQVPRRPTGPPVVEAPVPAPNPQLPSTVQPPASAQQPPAAAETVAPGPGGRRVPGEAASRPMPSPPASTQPPVAAADVLPPPPTIRRLPGEAAAQPQPMASGQPSMGSAEPPRRTRMLRSVRGAQRMTRGRMPAESMGSGPSRPELTRAPMAAGMPAMANPAPDPPYPWRGYPPNSWSAP